MTKSVLGVIGGSGVYDMAMEDSRWVAIASPWGETSDEFRIGTIHDVKVVFLPRHGRGHRISPTHINYRANIDAMKRAGVTDLVSISACGSFREHLFPGTFVIIDQFIDRTFAREKSFFGTGCVAPVSLAEPISPRLADRVAAAARSAGINCQRGGTDLCMEGPQFSTIAESKIYRHWGCDVIGMTNMPEAKLAREAELCYATVAMVTDFDSWHPGHGTVDIQAILEVVLDNAEKAKTLVTMVAPALKKSRPEPCPHGCDRALEHALITAPAARSAEAAKKLDAVAGRILKAS